MIKIIHKLSKPLLNNIPFTIISKKNPNSSNTNTNQKTKKRQIKVSKLKYNDEIGGYKIYETNLSKPFMYVSIALTSFFFTSGFIVFLTPSLGNFLTFGCISGFLYYHQNRLTHTVKEILVDKMGTNVRVRTYGYFGTEVKSSFTQVPIHILYAAKNMSYRRGLRILGGGIFGYAPIYYNFSRAGILDQRVFNAVVTGNSVVYADML